MRMRTVLAALFLLVCTGVQAQWAQTNGPEGGLFTTVAVNDSKIVGIANGSVVIYDGSSWKRTGSLRSARLEIVGNALIGARLRPDGLTDLYRSVNDGATWDSVAAVREFSVDGATLYALVGDTLGRSVDGGLTWTTVATAPEFMRAPVVHKGMMFAMAGFFGDEFHRSTDGGITWKRLDAPMMGGARVTTLVAGKEALFAGFMGVGVLRSVDGGVTWESIGQGFPESPEIQWILDDGTHIWTGGGTQLFRYDGERWAMIPMSTYFNQPVATKGGLILPTYGGAFRIDGASGMITSLNDGLYASSITTVAAVGSTVFAGTPAGVFRTADDGNRWTRVDALPGTTTTFITSQHTVWSLGGGLFRSTDRGESWVSMETRFSEPTSDVTGVAVGEDEADDRTVFIAVGASLSEHAQTVWVNGGVFRSNDNGETWTEISAGLPNDGFTTIPVNGVVVANGAVVITTINGLYRSTLAGGGWTPVNTGLSLVNGRPPVGVLFRMNGEIYFQTYTTIYRSVDGMSWAPIAQFPAEFMMSGSGSVVDGKLYMPGYRWQGGESFEYRIFLFDGMAWVDGTSTMPQGVVLNSFVRAGDHIYAGSNDQGVWASSSTAPTSAVNGGVSKSSDNLSIAPNPFDGSATVRVALAQAARLRLSVVDAVGAEAALLFDGPARAGDLAFEIAADRLAAGLYFLRIEIDGHVEMRTMVKM